MAAIGEAGDSEVLAHARPEEDQEKWLTEVLGDWRQQFGQQMVSVDG